MKEETRTRDGVMWRREEKREIGKEGKRGREGGKEGGRQRERERDELSS